MKSQFPRMMHQLLSLVCLIFVVLLFDLPNFRPPTKSSFEPWKDPQRDKHTPPPICLVAPFFGQTSNNIIELGKLIKLVKKEGKNRMVWLDEAWSAWYQDHFDPRNDVLLYYDGSGVCNGTYDTIDKAAISFVLSVAFNSCSLCWHAFSLVLLVLLNIDVL